MAELNVSMKLLIDHKGRRVLFAEAGKDAVDFLFSILSLPLGSVARYPKDMVWSIGNLYRSIGYLSDLRMIPNKNIDSLVKTVRATYPTTTNSPPVLLTTDNYSQPTDKSYYNPLTLIGKESSSSSSYFPIEGGFVKAGVSYMITDDLLVQPISTLSTVTVISSFNLKDVGSLEEKTVNLTVANVRDLLRASLETKNVLTSIFIEEKKVAKEEKSSETAE